MTSNNKQPQVSAGTTHESRCVECGHELPCQSRAVLGKASQAWYYLSCAGSLQITTYADSVVAAQASPQLIAATNLADDFDAWLASHYTKVLQKSIQEDYVPHGDCGPTTGRVSCSAPDSTGAASVDPTYHWLPVSAATPRGTKLQLIVRPDGVAQYGQYTPGSAWTHYALLPTFTVDDGAGNSK